MSATVGVWWNDRSIRAKGIALVLAPLLVLLVLAPLLLITMHASDRASAIEEHAIQTELAAGRALQDLLEAETNVRGFLLTGDGDLLLAYREARARTALDQAELLRLESNGDAQAEVQVLQEALDSRFAHLEGMVAVGFLRAWQVERGQQLTQAVRDGIQAIVTKEQGEYALSRSEHHATERLAALAVAIAIPVGAVLGLVLVVAFSRGIVRRVERNTVNAERLTIGQELLPPPEGGDEIGRSGRALVVAAAELTATQTDLARSNAELEQFAYVASHDLQEPLRMIAGHLQVLELDLEETLAEETAESLHFAVDGAKRTQTMINDLLTYSRIGTRSEGFGLVDLEAPLDDALQNLGVALRESEGSVTHGDLPVVEVDPRQLTQVFQNLVGNALKYRADEPPLVHVGAERRNGEWVVSVTDNGIGIPPEQSERIFKIFQRLHTRDQYEGTGIGLAVCRRIVERHHGRIWVESGSGRGSIFRFTLPATSGGKA